MTRPFSKGDRVLVTEGQSAGAVGWIVKLPDLTDSRFRVGLAASDGKEIWVRAAHLAHAV